MRRRGEDWPGAHWNGHFINEIRQAYRAGAGASENKKCRLQLVDALLAGFPYVGATGGANEAKWSQSLQELVAMRRRGEDWPSTHWNGRFINEIRKAKCKGDGASKMWKGRLWVVATQLADFPY